MDTGGAVSRDADWLHNCLHQLQLWQPEGRFLEKFPLFPNIFYVMIISYSFMMFLILWKTVDRGSSLNNVKH